MKELLNTIRYQDHKEGSSQEDDYQGDQESHAGKKGRQANN